jgi:hypothetical protein
MSPLTIYRTDGTPKTSAPSSLSIPMDTWHTVGAAGEPGFQNGWVAAASYPAQFRKDPLGKVQIRGMVKSGTINATVFTLPVGYRPAQNVSFEGRSYSGTYIAAPIFVGTDGTVVLWAPGTNTEFSLDAVAFDTDTVTAMPSGPPGPQGATGPQGGNSVILLDPWHTVGAAGEPAFGAGYSSTGSGNPPVSFRKDPLGHVSLRGVVNGTAAGVIFTLPAGYKPTAGYNRFVTTDLSGATAFVQVYIGSDGAVNKLASGGAVDLAVIEFDTDTVTQMPSGPKGDTGATGGNATVPMDTLHKVGAAGEPAFQNSWVHYDNGGPAPGGGTMRDAAFRKDPLGKVSVYGVVRSGATGTTVFTLPVGYRPTTSDRSFTVSAALGLAQISVMLDGRVMATNVGASNVTTYMYLDGIEFDTDTVTAMPTGPQGPQGPPGNSITVPMDTWHIIGAVGEAPFASGWGARSGGFTVQYRKDPLGKVSLRGCLQNTSAFSFSGTNTTLFTLPAGYRPAGDSEFICPILEPSGANSTGNHILVNVIAATGIVSISQFGPMPGVSGGAGTYLWVDELDFDTGLVTAMPTGPQGPPGPSTPVQRVTSLPGNMYDGLEVYLVAAAGPPAVIWHMRFNGTTNKWEYIGGPPISYQMEGANIGYVGATNNTNITVDAAQSTLLQWLFTPPVDCWIELTMNVSLMAKTDAAYHYAYLNLIASPAPAIGTVSSGPYQTQHSQVQQYMGYQFTKRFALTAGVAYQFYGQWAMSGGTWSYYQGPGTLWLTGKAWPR